MTDYLKIILSSQFEAALAMFNDCAQKCPPEHWDGKIAKYPFWQVAYHTLCFVDLYLAPNEETFEPRADLHPQGWREFDDEYPSRRFEQREILNYVTLCLEKARQTFAAETAATLAGPSGHKRRTFSRSELHIYNLRHLQHHTGQLSAFLRQVGADPKWFSAGWPEN